MDDFACTRFHHLCFFSGEPFEIQFILHIYFNWFMDFEFSSMTCAFSFLRVYWFSSLWSLSSMNGDILLFLKFCYDFIFAFFSSKFRCLSWTREIYVGHLQFSSNHRRIQKILLLYLLLLNNLFFFYYYLALSKNKIHLLLITEWLSLTNQKDPFKNDSNLWIARSTFI